MSILANQTVTHLERRHRRMRVLKGAQLRFRNKLVSIDCTMRDLSTGGARLRLSGPTGLPDSFDLKINGTSECFPARLVWRRGNDIGVSFDA